MEIKGSEKEANPYKSAPDSPTSIGGGANKSLYESKVGITVALITLLFYAFIVWQTDFVMPPSGPMAEGATRLQFIFTFFVLLLYSISASIFLAFHERNKLFTVLLFVAIAVWSAFHAQCLEIFRQSGEISMMKFVLIGPRDFMQTLLI